ncbi:hypothetical protein [Chondromyces apiculatus]|uniref:UvrABC system protein A n=1 Tax=Chondromyces apiculatus DSM 436 TaxID=1192034 RepID=A0A017TGA2_9BACT|nr:hypothetical protein [Chondromyces apiculatus]EYF08274.1 Hypothetical protein CAP_6035 [Chondromyces apiculatus DSM 436]
MTKGKASDAAHPHATIDIVGADAHNLKQVDVRIPLNRVTVVTGISGSGKSSLLTDTLAVEADQRMRTFLGVHQPQLEGTPPRAFIGPMPAAIHVGQRAFRASARTTVATATGFMATLRRLYLACARPYSDRLERFVPGSSPASYAAWLTKHYRGPATVSAVPVYFTATDGVRCAERLRESGIAEVVVRSRTDSPKAWERGRKVSTARWKPLNATVQHIIEASLGELTLTPKSDRKKLEALLQQAFDAGQGQVFVDLPAATQPELRGPFGPRLDSALHCVDPEDATCFFQPNRHLLSFNAPEHPESGACRRCHGLGRATTLDEHALVEHPDRPMSKGAFSIWTEKNYKHVNIQHATIEGLRGTRGFSPDVAWSKLPKDARELVLNGAGDVLVTDVDPVTHKKLGPPRPFEGFRHAILERVGRGTKVSESLAPLVSEGPCPDCGGSRWSHQARALRIDRAGVHDLLAKPFLDVVPFTEKGSQFAAEVPADCAALVRMLHDHAAAFVSLGLGHLSGDRGMLEISEGEGRRARLAAVLNSRHAGLCMLLDEPARGLHDEDVGTMASAIRELAHAHSVVMNEHRHALVKAAHHVIELGPGAGHSGGEVVHEGSVRESSWAKAPTLDRVLLPVPRAQPRLTIHGATIHNLDAVDCAIPLGRLTCLTGLSGSGKSSFVRGVLVPAVAGRLPKNADIEDFERRRGTWTRLDGAETLRGLVALDQKAPSPNRRSIVATFLGMAEAIRTAFGASDQARRAGLAPTDFGLNAGTGRCQVCLGIGEIAEHDQWTSCPVCGGTRFGQDALSVRVDGMNISDLLEVPVEALQPQVPSFLTGSMPILAAMVDLGIGHIALGRRVDTLSGGEVQRLRIAAKLADHDAGDLLFVLDEPAAGLHPTDVERLVRALDRILDRGKNTVVLVEHNPAIIQAADWIIEFGPGSGPHGGRIVAYGPPDEIRATDTATGRVLAGRTPPEGTRPPRVRPAPAASDGAGDPLAQAERVRAWLKHLVGDGVAPPEDGPDDAALDRPAVVLSDRFWLGRGAWELGGLDLELSKLLLDVHQSQTAPDALDAFARAWVEVPDGRLCIQPHLKDIQRWGPRLPASTVQTTLKHLRSMGLELIPGSDTSRKRKAPGTAPAEVLDARATGDRFVPRQQGLDERRRLIADALALGGDYVELRDTRGKLLQAFGPRLVDLTRGIVGPMAPAPFHFSRHDPRGQCPMCKGTGLVMALEEALVVRNQRAAPEEDDFLHPAAAAILKGIRRSDLLPFLRHLEEEGLWTGSTPYSKLDPAARTTFLFGCWTRPGLGTFLKKGKDPSEVGSWLTWDGLFRVLWGERERSTDARWRASLEQSRAFDACPSCEGSGLAPQARLLLLADRSLQEWVCSGTLLDLHSALRDVRTASRRQKHTQKRLLGCLAPLAKEAGARPLRERLDTAPPHEVGQRVVEAFTDMPAVFM